MVGELRQFEAVGLSETEAIRRAQRGDSAAFETLYRLHSGRVFALCLRMLGNSADAEDQTEEAFLTVFRSIHLFQGRSAFSTWLHRIAVNLVLMRLRKKTVKQTSLEEIAETRGENRARQLELSAPDLHLTGLIPCSKLQFVLYDILGYAHREIARIRGCTAGNSKLQLHRTRQRL